MATSIYFNSRLTAVPGSYTEVDASGLASVGLGATGVVACIGEVEGSEPQQVYNVTNPGQLGKLFRSGDLLEGGTMLFDPSKDPDIPGGAQEVKFIKVNPALQAELDLRDDLGGIVLEITSKDYGAFTDKINVYVADGDYAGTKAVTVNFESVTEVFNNIGLEGVGTLTYSGPTAIGDVVFTHAGGLQGLIADNFTGLDGDGDFKFQTYSGLSGQITGQPTPTETLDIVSSDAGDTSYPVLIYGTDGGGLPVSELIVTNAGDGTIQANGVQGFDTVHGIIFVSGVNPIGTITIDGNTSATVIVATSLLARGVSALMSAPNPAALFWDAAGGVITTEATGPSTDTVMFVGFRVGAVPAAEVITLNGTTPVDTVINDWEEISYILTGLLPGGVDIEITARACMDDVGWIASTDPLDTTQTVTVYGLDAVGAVQSEEISLTGTSVVFTTGVWSRIDGAFVNGPTAGSVYIGSGNNVAEPIRGRMLITTVTAFTSGLQVAPYSFPQPGTLNWSATDANFSGIVIGRDSSYVQTMELISGLTGTTATSWFETYYIAALTTPATTTIWPSYTAFILTEAAYPTFQDWENFFASTYNWALAKVSSSPSDEIQISRLDEVTTPETAIGGYTFRDVLADIAEVLTAGSAYVNAEVVPGAPSPPANSPFPLYLTGGTEGVTGFADWQQALDNIRDYRVNTVVVLTSDPAVQAATIAHCKYMCGAGRSERDCVLGSPPGITLTDAKALALSMNTRHARLVIQSMERFNTSGQKEQFSPIFTACLAAGMQAGSDVGTSLTFKYVNLLRVEDRTSTYDIQDNGNELIQAGLDVIAKVPNVGYRWLRNVTTYLIDDNLAYVEASVNEAVNYAVYNFRTALEVMVGKKGFSGTVTATQGLAVSILGQLVGVGAITAWKNLTITLTGDTMTVDVEIAPIIPVNFIKTTIHLVSSTFEATT